MELAPIKRMNLRDRIAENLREYILSSGLAPGDKLPSETELASRFKVSRTALREALKTLEGMSIVCSRQGEGIFVAAFDMESLIDSLSYNVRFGGEDIREVLEIRKVLELAWIERAVKSASEQQISRLERVVSEMRAVANAGKDITALDMKFHDILYQEVANRLFYRLSTIFWKLLVTQKTWLDPDRFASVERHERLLNAIRKRDAELAFREMAVHFDNYGAL